MDLESKLSTGLLRGGGGVARPLSSKRLLKKHIFVDPLPKYRDDLGTWNPFLEQNHTQHFFSASQWNRSKLKGVRNLPWRRKPFRKEYLWEPFRKDYQPMPSKTVSKEYQPNIQESVRRILAKYSREYQQNISQIFKRVSEEYQQIIQWERKHVSFLNTRSNHVLSPFPLSLMAYAHSLTNSQTLD